MKDSFSARARIRAPWPGSDVPPLEIRKVGGEAQVQVFLFDELPAERVGGRRRGVGDEGARLRCGEGRVGKCGFHE